jgi:hypothetical protein
MEGDGVDIRHSSHEIIENKIKNKHFLFMISNCFFAAFYLFVLAAFGDVSPYIQEKEFYSVALSSNTLVAITFHYDESRLCYLEKVLQSLGTFPKADIVIFTNTPQHRKQTLIHRSIKKALPSGVGGGSVSIKRVGRLNHPFELTWCHKGMINDDFLNSRKGYTHFIYLEDDIGLDFNNFCYFVHFREILKPDGLIPAFLRVEINSKGQIVATDNYNSLDISNSPKIFYENLLFLNALNPYMACFILDRELAEEYVKSCSFHKEKSLEACPWDIRERAAIGLCFENIPSPFSSRFVIPLLRPSLLENQRRLSCPDYSLIYHLPNNKANDPETEFGKLPIEDLFFYTKNSSL